MKNQYFLVLILFCGVHVFAQQARTKPVFYMIPQAGLLNGDHSASGQVTLVAGFERKGWGLGLGSAIDYYKVRTVPVFIDIRKDITKDQQPIFTYLDLGRNIAAPLELQYSRPAGWWGTGKSRFSNGLYGEWGIGYALLNKKRKGLVMGLGYSIKTVTEKYDEIVYHNFPPYARSDTYERELRYTFNRVMIRLGLRL